MQDERQHNEVTLGIKDKPITVGSIRVDRSHLQVSVDGKTLSLTVRESLLLHFLAVHANTVCTFGQIGSQVEGFTNDGATGFIKAYIHRLRLKIEPDPMHPIYLLTIPEVGYTFVSHEYE